MWQLIHSTLWAKRRGRAGPAHRAGPPSAGARDLIGFFLNRPQEWRNPDVRVQEFRPYLIGHGIRDHSGAGSPTRQKRVIGHSRAFQFLRPDDCLRFKHSLGRDHQERAVHVRVTINRHVSDEISQNRAGLVINASLTYFIPPPALFTRISRRPNRFAAATISQSLAFVTSATRGTTVAAARETPEPSPDDAAAVVAESLFSP